MAHRNPILRRNALRRLSAGGIGGLAFARGLAKRGRVALAADTVPRPIKIVTGYGNIPLILQHILIAQGYMEEFGVQPIYSNVTDGNRIMDSLISGTMDMCALSGFAQVPVAVEKGAGLKVLAGAALLLNQCVFAKQPGITRVADLAGKTVGVGSVGSLLNQLMVTLLKKKGVDVGSVRFVNVGNNQDVFRAVVAGVVDAGPSTIEVYNQQAQYGVHSLTDGAFWTELPEYTQQGSYASDRAIAAKRETLVRTLAAYGKLYRFLQTPESRDIFIAAHQAIGGGKVAASDAAFQWNWIQQYKPFDVGLVLSEERMTYLQDINVAFGAQKKVLPFDAVADMSLARDAVKLMDEGGRQ